MQPLYTSVKVNNEIELCEIFDSECKKVIEQTFLKQHISFFIRWPKANLFNRRKDSCIICVNDHAKDEAESIVRTICDEAGYHVRFIIKKTQHNYF